jgi:hypothetical protein
MQHLTNVKGYVKDVSTGVVVNNDSQEYAAYILQREHNRKLQNCQKDIQSLKDELHELKAEFHKIINEK